MVKCVFDMSRFILVIVFCIRGRSLFSVFCVVCVFFWWIVCRFVGVSRVGRGWFFGEKVVGFLVVCILERR